MFKFSQSELIDFSDRLLEKRWAFLGIFFLVFIASYLFLTAIDFIPEPVAAEINEGENESDVQEENEIHKINLTANLVAADKEVLVETEFPVEIYIERLDKKISVSNPSSRNVQDLDSALLSGAVRHPDSAKLGQTGNVFILGHSSYLPTVFNQNFKAFNGIEKLEWGDTVEVKADNRVFVYRVDRVYKADAQELIVPIAGEEKRLTLATCDSFGSVEDRFIVEAIEVENREI